MNTNHFFCEHKISNLTKNNFELLRASFEHERLSTQNDSVTLDSRLLLGVASERRVSALVLILVLKKTSAHSLVFTFQFINGVQRSLALYASWKVARLLLQYYSKHIICKLQAKDCKFDILGLKFYCQSFLLILSNDYYSAVALLKSVNVLESSIMMD